MTSLPPPAKALVIMATPEKGWTRSWYRLRVDETKVVRTSETGVQGKGGL